MNKIEMVKLATELFSLAQVLQEKLDVLQGTNLYQKAMKHHAKLLQFEIDKLLKQWYHINVGETTHDAHKELWRVQEMHDSAISKVFSCPINLLHALPSFIQAFNDGEVEVNPAKK